MASGGGGDYITWSVPALKKELSLRGAVTRGRKTDLIERLNAYDRNKNFQEEPVILPEPLDVGWPVSGFRQLLAEHKMVLPKITKEQIDAYFVYRLADFCPNYRTDFYEDKADESQPLYMSLIVNHVTSGLV
ncbi:uncharacterized protein LOC134697517 [Mytilus trossulus]|uniref:uncharacterized protein LOC134697517 n=1 Tax=Mytilus trossulus TaxID=6551 RepID=UPI003004CCB2